MVVKADSKTEDTHPLFIVIKNDEISVNSFVFSDQMEQRNSHVAQRKEAIAFHIVRERFRAFSGIERSFTLV